MPWAMSTKKVVSILHPWTSSLEFIDFVCMVYRFAWADSLIHITCYAILCAVFSENLFYFWYSHTGTATEARIPDAKNSSTLRTTHGHSIRVLIFSRWSKSFDYCYLVEFWPTVSELQVSMRILSFVFSCKIILFSKYFLPTKSAKKWMQMNNRFWYAFFEIVD